VKQLVSLVLIWLGTVALAVITWPGAAGGFRHELGIVLAGVAGTIVIRTSTTFKRDRRDPMFSFLASSWWFIYLGLTVVLAFASAIPVPTEALVTLHVVNLAVALGVRGLAMQVHEANAERRVEKKPIQDLQAATARLKLESGGWPVADQRPAIDAALSSLLDALRYAPGRVVPEFEQVVADAVAVVDSTAKRLRAADGKPAAWYLAEVKECERFVNGQLAHLQGQMSARRV